MGKSACKCKFHYKVHCHLKHSTHLQLPYFLKNKRIEDAERLMMGLAGFGNHILMKRNWKSETFCFRKKAKGCC